MQELRDLLDACWHADSAKRPAFKEVCEEECEEESGVCEEESGVCEGGRRYCDCDSMGY